MVFLVIGLTVGAGPESLPLALIAARGRFPTNPGHHLGFALVVGPSEHLFAERQGIQTMLVASEPDTSFGSEHRFKKRCQFSSST